MTYIQPRDSVTISIPAGQSIRIGNSRNASLQLVATVPGTLNGPVLTIPADNTTYGPYSSATDVKLVNLSYEIIEYDVAVAPVLADDSGAPISFTSRVLTDRDDDKVAVCSTAQVATVNTGLKFGFGCAFRGPVTFNGTATVNERRTSGAANPVCSLMSVGVDQYDAIGSMV